MAFNFFHTPLCLGLDIHPDGIFMAQLRVKKRQFVLVRFLEQPWACHFFVDGRVTDWPAFQAELTQFVRMHHLKGEGVAICLPETWVYSRVLTLPYPLHDADLESEILLQLQQYFPHFSEALQIDFEVTSQHEDHQEVFAIATQKNYLLAYIDSVEKTGLRVKVVDSETFALKRSQESPISSISFEHHRYLRALGLAMRERPRW